MPEVSTMKCGEVVFEITNPRNVEPVSADVLVECRHFNGIICLSFASLSMDGTGEMKAEISARIRLSVPGTMDLGRTLDRTLQDAMPGKETVN